MWRLWSLRRRMAAGAMMFALVLSGVMTIGAGFLLDHVLTSALKSSGEKAVASMVESVRPWLGYNDAANAEKELSGIHDEAIVQFFACTWDEGSRSWSLSAQSRKPDGAATDLAAFLKALPPPSKSESPLALPEVDGRLLIGRTLALERGNQMAATVAVLDPSGARAERNRKAAVLALIGLAAAILGGLGTRFMVRKLLKPLEAIEQRMRDISEGEGDLTARLDVNGTDEIAALAGHFNRFVENIHGIVQQVMAISTNIASGSLQMSAGMSEMHSTAQSIAQAAENQKSSVTTTTTSVQGIAEQNAAAMEEMAATIKESTRTVDELSHLAEQLNALVARFRV